MNKFLPNHNIKSKRINIIELHKFIKKCKSLNILNIKTIRDSYTKIEFKHNNINYFIAEIIDNHLEYNYIDKVNKQYKINYDLNRISI
tara:strand:+ start:371 stop:634 length:264 start_codon:yes stop_codon:yes gene_type:complete